MRIVPSDVLRQIKRFFPSWNFDNPTGKLTLFAGHRSYLTAILELTERIPSELIALNAEDFCALQTAVASMSAQMDFLECARRSIFRLNPRLQHGSYNAPLFAPF